MTRTAINNKTTVASESHGSVVVTILASQHKELGSSFVEVIHSFSLTFQLRGVFSHGILLHSIAALSSPYLINAKDT